MAARDTERLMEAYVDAINTGDLDRLEPLLAPNVTLHAPPHTDRFPQNVIARLRQERRIFPNLRIDVERAFTDTDGSLGVLVARWSGRKLSSRICLLFQIECGRIVEIEPYGGLMKTMYDAGLLKIAS